jgi:uncharacterized membrane protein
MVSSDLRKSARVALQGKWGKSALLTLCYLVITFAITFVLNLIPVIGGIAQVVISLPISFGLLAVFMKLKRNEDVGYADFLSIGFSNFGKVWGVLGNIILKMIIPIVLVIVFIVIMILGMGGSFTSILATSYTSSSYTTAAAGFGGIAVIGFIGYIASIIYTVVKGYLYSLSFYILYDNPDKSGKEIVEESESMMKGNRWRFFWLGITFIGWVILSAFTLYIGMLWVFPYILVTFVCFYEDLAGKSVTPEVENINTVVEE